MSKLLCTIGLHRFMGGWYGNPGAIVCIRCGKLKPPRVADGLQLQSVVRANTGLSQASPDLKEEKENV